MDADYDPNAATLEDRNFGLDGGRSKKSKRRKSRLRKALEKKKPVFNPSKLSALRTNCPCSDARNQVPLLDML